MYQQTYTEGDFTWKLPVWRDWQLVIVLWVFFAVSAICVGIRLYVQRGVIRKRPWGEFFTVMALLALLGNDICYSLELRWHYFDWRPQYFTHQFREHDYAEQAGYVNGALFLMNCLFLCKASLLCFYSEIAPKHIFPRIWITMNVTWVLVLGSILTQIVWGLFGCWPISSVWKDAFGPSSDKCNWSSEIQDNVVTSLHLLTDVLVYVIPFIILYYLQNLSKRQKFEARMLFGLGFFNILIAIATVASNWASLPESRDHAGTILLGAFLFLDSAQQFTAMIIITAPYVRKYIRNTDWHKMRSRAKVFSPRSGMTTSGPDSIISPVARKAAEGARRVDAEMQVEGVRHVDMEMQTEADDGARHVDLEMQTEGEDDTGVKVESSVRVSDANDSA